jgi:hypothetical protein
MTGASVPVDGGGAMRVHFPGWRNRSAGPDFRDAVIEADGATLRGDVEVHRDARDWVRHGHDADPRYGNVVLHVVEDAPDNPPGPARRARASALAALAPEANRSPFACRPQGALGADKVRASLISVGMARYRVAADRLRLRLNDVLPDADQSRATEQSVFEEIAAALGFAGNEAAMRRCAQALPLAVLRAMPDGSSGASDPALEAMLARAFDGGAGGLTMRGPSSSHQGSHQLRWVLAGVRPSNHPRRRLAQLVEIARAWPDVGMVAAVRDGLCATADKPWRSGPRLRALVATNASARSRAGDVVVNVLLPLARAVALHTGDADALAWADAAFTAHPMLSGNGVIARVASRIGVAPRLVANTAAAQQGLIAIWDGPCRPLRCHLCPLAWASTAVTPAR